MAGFFVAGGGLVPHARAEGAVPAEALQGDAQAGREAVSMCRTCHGLDGVARIPIAPHIGGEPAGYLMRQLTAFREGKRSHEMMSVVARGLSDQAIADLAAWYSSLTATASLPAGHVAEEAPELCVACHGEAGLSQVDDAPHLAAESVMYLDTQLKAFRSGKRAHEIMSPIAESLSDDEIRAFAEWYAAITLKVETPH